MFVYIWKDQNGTPFYVGVTKTLGRTNPRNSQKRNRFTTARLDEIGRHNVIVEIRPVESIVAGQALERKLIAEYGRMTTSDGTLTNLGPGGEGVHIWTEEHREKMRAPLRSPSHPIRSEAARDKQRQRMHDPDIQALFKGDANPAKRPEVREKLKAIWQDPEYKARQTESRTGLVKNLSKETRQKLAEQVKVNPAMKGWGERNGKDSEFDAKRIAGIRAAQPKRLEKMADPEALAKRKAKLKETLNSEEFKAKRAQWDTPEYRKKLSDNKKAYWAKKRMEKLSQS